MARYVVQAGDTAALIAWRIVRDPSRWTELCDVNPAHGRWDLIWPGETLNLPASWTTTPPTTSIGALDTAAARSATSWLSDADFAAFVAMCGRVGMNPYDFGAVMYHESGWHTAARNPKTDATGLIQWMPENRPAGLSQAALAGLSFQAQLGYVEKWAAGYARARGGPFRSGGEIYAIVFCPGRISPSMSENTVAFSSGTNVSWNASLDADGDGVIRIGDMTRLVESIKSSHAFAPFAARIAAAGGGDDDGSPSTTPAGGSARSSSAPSSKLVGAAILATAIAAAAYEYREEIGPWTKALSNASSRWLSRLPRYAS